MTDVNSHTRGNTKKTKKTTCFIVNKRRKHLILASYYKLKGGNYFILASLVKLVCVSHDSLNFNILYRHPFYKIKDIKFSGHDTFFDHKRRFYFYNLRRR